MKSKKIAERREDARAAPNIVMPFATEEGDVAGIVQGLRDLAYMLECSHIQYISGGVSAIPTHTARGEQIQIQVDTRLTLMIQNDT